MGNEITEIMKIKTVNILGTEYTVYICNYEESDGNLRKSDNDGCCCSYDKELYILDFKNDEYWKTGGKKAVVGRMRQVIRHEVIHAFLYESGLQESALSTCWAKNEEMVDWFANQWEKINAVCKELGAI